MPRTPEHEPPPIQFGIRNVPLLHFDVVLLHPPSRLDYGKTPCFPGPIARTVSTLSPLFVMIPVGLLSIAGHLIENGFNTKILNLAEHLLESPNFKVAEYIKSLDSKIFGIDLHWDVHSRGHSISGDVQAATP